MNRFQQCVFGMLCAMASLAACEGPSGQALREMAIDSRASDDLALKSVPEFPHRRVCDEPTEPGQLACHARVRVDEHGDILSAAVPQGFKPADLVSAYNIAPGGGGVTIGIVDAMSSPTIASDLAVYRSEFGLPACTVANGCLKIVNQIGESSPLPANDKGWAGEIMLDLEMASAACPNCKLLIVLAKTASQANLGAAENAAVALGANVVSNSYGGPESADESASDTAYYHHPGTQIFFSNGDEGYGAEYPAASQYVTAVGGTTLAKSTSVRGWAEGAWNETGSGCSKYIAKPAWQMDTGCAHRTIGDVSAVADPNTGVAVYDSYGSGGWAVYGGTSAATPLVAGIFATSGHTTTDASFIYANAGTFYDVTTGNNGPCSVPYLCTAGAGYDGPTGWGTPNEDLLASIGSVIGGDGGGGSGGGGESGGGAGGGGGGSGGGGGGSGGGGGGSGGGGGGSGGGGGGGLECARHSECVTGVRLKASCNVCAREICSEDHYCCSIRWDSICVSEVASICGDECD